VTFVGKLIPDGKAQHAKKEIGHYKIAMRRRTTQMGEFGSEYIHAAVEML
jgi:hypothetical protein